MIEIMFTEEEFATLIDSVAYAYEDNMAGEDFERRVTALLQRLRNVRALTRPEPDA